jgi:hypothetical protein
MHAFEHHSPRLRVNSVMSHGRYTTSKHILQVMVVGPVDLPQRLVP